MKQRSVGRRRDKALSRKNSHWRLALFSIAALLTVWQIKATTMPASKSPLAKLLDWIRPEELPPPSFRFGVASASYQIEGAVDQGGRSPSIWDTFSRTPGKTHNGDTGDVACEFYFRYKEDIALMKRLGVRMFRFSLSWSRILPAGRGQVNKAGVEFYSSVIDELIAAGIEPHITLYHWDLPQILEDEYKGWLSRRVVDDFVGYAEACFRAFGDRVTHWTTFNEPWTFVFLGYDMGIHAPGRGSDRSRCPAGDSSKEPWIVTHNVLNAHGAAVARFRELLPRGRISMNLNSDWAEPMTSSKKDKIPEILARNRRTSVQAAAQRHLDFSLGLYADPIFKGDYPESVRERVVGLPKFSAEEKELLKGSLDYFALNHYTSKYVANSKEPFSVQGTDVSAERGGSLIGPQADSEWLNVVPWGFGKLLLYVQERYGDPDIYVTESGVDVPKESSLPLDKALDDQFRLKYYKLYLREAVKAAVKHGVKIEGYFAWSILDNFEWADGYAKRFGIVYVDYKHGLARHVKASANWLATFFGTSSKGP